MDAEEGGGAATEQPGEGSSRNGVQVGFVTEITSYTSAKALVVVPTSRVLRYGALVELRDARNRKRYLAVVVDVRERSVAPFIDADRLRDLSRQAQARGLKDASRLLEALYSPSQGLVQLYGVRELELRVLGEIVTDTSGARLAPASQPPRPGSIVVEPEPPMLQEIVSGGLAGSGQGLYIGFLAYNPQVKVYLDPRALNTHVAVIGQTGTGKTEAVKRLVAEYAWKKHLFSKRGGIVVFDASGEYMGYPYRPPDPNTVPLLDAILEPWKYYDGEAEWARGARKTVIVFYDPVDTGPRRGPSLLGPEEYVVIREARKLVEKLYRDYHGVPHPGVEGFRALVFTSNYALLVEAREDGETEKRTVWSREELVEILGSSKYLVIIMPLPDTLSIDELVEISGTRSSYFYDVISELAEKLGILYGDHVYSATFLHEFVEVAIFAMNRSQEEQWGDRKKSPHPRELVKDVFKKIVDRLLEAKAAGSLCKEVKKALESFPWIPRYFSNEYITCDAWLDYLLLVLSRGEVDELMSPGEGLTNILGGLSEEEVFERRRELASRVSAAVDVLNAYQWQTRASVRRGLRIVSRRVSSVLSPGVYKVLLDRVLDGFTIVNLAISRSRDTLFLAAKLLKELFLEAVREYEPGAMHTLIVAEEAHNLIPAGEDTETVRALRKLAQEGRKWGLSLVLVSQKPNFIDPGALSQAATIIALRVSNPEDISSLKKSVESVSQEFAERLPDLDRGQAIVSGLAVPERRIPLLVQVDMLKPLPSEDRVEGRNTTKPSGQVGGVEGERRRQVRGKKPWKGLEYFIPRS